MHGQSAYGYAKRSMSTNAASEAVAADSEVAAPPPQQSTSLAEDQEGLARSGSLSQLARKGRASSSSSLDGSVVSVARSGKISRSHSLCLSKQSSSPKTLSANQAGKLRARTVETEVAGVQSPSASSQSAVEAATTSSSSSITNSPRVRPSAPALQTPSPRIHPRAALERAVLKDVPHLFNLSNSKSGVSPERYQKAVSSASSKLQQCAIDLRTWDDEQTALVVALLDAHAHVEVDRMASDHLSAKSDPTFGLSELASSIVGLHSASTPMELCGAMVATGVSIGDVYITTLGWYESNNAFEQLRSQDGQPEYVEQMRQYLQLTLETLCKEIAQDLRLGQRLSANSDLKSRHPEDFHRYYSAVASYTIILLALQKGLVYQSSYLQPILKMILLSPKSPDSEAVSRSSIHAKNVLGTGRKAMTLQDATRDHTCAYNYAQATLVTLLEHGINDSEMIKGGSWRSDFVAAPPSITAGRRRRTTIRKSLSRHPGSRWELWPQPSSDTLAVQLPSPDVTLAANSEVAQSTQVRIMKDLPSLLLLFRYAYQHLASFRAANAFYECVVAPALQEALISQNSAVRDAAIVHQEHCDIMRLRGGSLLRQNAEVDELIMAIITQLSDEADRNALQAGVDEETLRSWKGEKVYGVSMWQPQTLLRSESVSNAIVTAIISHWISTSRFDWTRYFIHHFLSLRAHVRISEESQLDEFASNHQDEDVDGFAQDTSRARLRKWVSSSELLIVMLNAARKAGTISLTESLWVAARREERLAAWILPVQGYTIMFQTYERQAARELFDTRSGKEQTFSWTSLEQQDSGNESGPDEGTGDTRRGNPRSSLQHGNDPKPAWYKAWDVYLQLAEYTQTGRILPDAVMFNNLLDVLLTTYERCMLRGNPDLEAEGEARAVMRRLAFLHRDILNAGLAVPPALRNLVHPHPTGLLQYHRSRHPAASHAKRHTLRKRHEQVQAHDGGQADFSASSVASKRFRALPSRAERIAHLPSRYKEKQLSVGRWNNQVRIQARLESLEKKIAKAKPAKRKEAILWKRKRKEHDLYTKRLAELSS